MHAYLVSPAEGAPESFATDLRGVRQRVRVIPKDYRHEARVMLVDVPTNKAAVVALLNGQEPPRTLLRKWRLSVRGRLIEIDVKEE